MSRIGLTGLVIGAALGMGSAAAQAPAAGCEAWLRSFEGGIGASNDAGLMVDSYRRMPRECVAERAQALLRVAQTARANGLVLEADEAGSPVVRPATGAALPSSLTPPMSAPGVSAPVAASVVGTSVVLGDADLLASPTRRDYANPPSALERLGNREVVVVVSGILQADGAFAWSVQSETPAESGLRAFALRLADRYRARTARPDGASLVGGQIVRTFRFRGS
jgi:hypothetical protein